MRRSRRSRRSRSRKASFARRGRGVLNEKRWSRKGGGAAADAEKEKERLEQEGRKRNRKALVAIDLSVVSSHVDC